MKRKLFFSFLLFLVLVCISIFIYRRLTIRNIFDEIYTNQKIATTVLPFTPRLESIDGVTNPAKGEPSGNGRYEVYASDNLPTNINDIRYVFNFSSETGVDKRFVIVITQNINDANTASAAISYVYNGKNRNLERIIRAQENSGHLVSSETEVETILAANGTTVQKVREYSDEILKTKVLKDWTSVYPSRFSPDHWGDVKLVHKWADE